uniref:Steroid 5-alpha reductase C-terminal domain-containing protein n=1 Tax=Scleropages formosus TaxID=113540 RepID=A0A8C9T0N1_SCLFO
LSSATAEELQLLNRLSYVMIFMGIVTFVSLLFENVPYGRYSNTKYGFPINAKLAWFLQELPAFVVPLLIVVGMSGAKLSQLPNRLLLLMFFCHYASWGGHVGPPPARSSMGVWCYVYLAVGGGGVTHGITAPRNENWLLARGMSPHVGERSWNCCGRLRDTN